MMIFVQKVSLGYNEVQDRVSLTAQSAEGEVMLLWLTQRLLNRLTRELIHWLDDDLQAVINSSTVQEFKTSVQSPVQRPPPSSEAPVHANILPGLHAFEQRAAQSALKSEKPVTSDLPMKEYLLKTIDLARLPNAYRIVFKWDEDGGAKLCLDSLQLRQFMGMLYSVFALADWSRHSWPDWFSSEPSGGEFSPQTLLH